MINEIIEWSFKYLKGRSVFPVFQRILRLILNVCIASFIYEALFFKYHWIDFTNYKLIFDFFVRGHFVIPLMIFLIVISFNTYFPKLIFSLINNYRSMVITRKIVLNKMNKNIIENEFKVDFNVLYFLRIGDLSNETQIKELKKFSAAVTPELLIKVEKKLAGPKLQLTRLFVLSFTLLIASFIFWYSLPEFGNLTFIITFITVLVIMIIIFCIFWILDAFPLLLREVQYQCDKLIAHLSAQNTSSINGEKV